ncbi:hypothetical protein [Kozakia baliensis]|uniref:hypothetical protein n=1 Tax=Kozakia baliensis TaxID=153496 RepID=UPI0004952D6E|nr:hypothetical protein [Kozakia baliensis]
MTKNRNFDEIHVGTVVGFDGAESIYRNIPYLITGKDGDGWIMQAVAGDGAVTPRYVGISGWEMFGGYIIGQPKSKAPEQPVTRTDTDRLEWLEKQTQGARAGILVGAFRSIIPLRAAIDAAMDKESGK